MSNIFMAKYNREKHFTLIITIIYRQNKKAAKVLLVQSLRTSLSCKDLGLFLFKEVKSTDFLLFRTPSAVMYNMKTAIIFVLINKMSPFCFSL